MAFKTIELADIAAGEPVTVDLMRDIKDNLDFLEQAVVGVEEVGVFELYNLTVLSPKNIDEINAKMPVAKIKSASRITGFRLSFPEVWAGAAQNLTGDLEIQLQKSTDGGTTWNNILSSPITATTQGVGDEVTGLSFVSEGDELAAGDMLRFRYLAGKLRALEPNHNLLLTGESV